MLTFIYLNIIIYHIYVICYIYIYTYHIYIYQLLHFCWEIGKILFCLYVVPGVIVCENENNINWLIRNLGGRVFDNLAHVTFYGFSQNCAIAFPFLLNQIGLILFHANGFFFLESANWSCKNMLKMFCFIKITMWAMNATVPFLYLYYLID